MRHPASHDRISSATAGPAVDPPTSRAFGPPVWYSFSLPSYHPHIPDGDYSSAGERKSWARAGPDRRSGVSGENGQQAVFRPRSRVDTRPANTTASRRRPRRELSVPTRAELPQLSCPAFGARALAMAGCRTIVGQRCEFVESIADGIIHRSGLIPNKRGTGAHSGTCYWLVQNTLEETRPENCLSRPDTQSWMSACSASCVPLSFSMYLVANLHLRLP